MRRFELALASTMMLTGCADVAAVRSSLSYGDPIGPVCAVDPTDTLGHEHRSIQDALESGRCDQYGSQIIVVCPPAGCSHGPFTLEGLSEVQVLSGEMVATGGPVSFVGDPTDPVVVHIRDSDGIELLGFRSYEGGEVGIHIERSGVILRGPPAFGEATYATVRAIGTGLMVRGQSSIQLDWLGFVQSVRGMHLSVDSSGAPEVAARGLALLDNTIAAELSGTTAASRGPRLQIRSDFGVAWLNYVMGNARGLVLHGHARLEIDHSVLAANLRPNLHPAGVFELNDASSLVGRNVLAYDNDAIVNPGEPTPHYPSAANTRGAILLHRSTGAASFVASTFVDNQCDLVFGLSTAPGDLTLDRVAVVNNWGKAISASTFSPGCPSAVMSTALFWANFVNADPIACYSGVSQDPNLVASRETPGELSAFPRIEPPRGDLYLLDPLEPSPPVPPPSGLFDSGRWGVDGTADEGALDVGFHNPLLP